VRLLFETKQITVGLRHKKLSDHWTQALSHGGNQANFQKDFESAKNCNHSQNRTQISCKRKSNIQYFPCTNPKIKIIVSS